MQGPALCNPQPSYPNSYQGLILPAWDNTHQVLKVRENTLCENKCFYDILKSTVGKEAGSQISISALCKSLYPAYTVTKSKHPQRSQQRLCF